MERIKKINIVSAGKVLAVVYALFGLLVGTFLSLAAAMKIEIPRTAQNPNTFGVASIIILPIIYGIIGLVGGMIMACFYNLAARWTGGLEIEKE